jgi:hypothetical protein
MPVSIPLLALAVCAGCAQPTATATGAGPTTAMGAGPSPSPGATASNERTLYCKDGSYVTKKVGCAGGVERDLTPPATTQK